jgi:hypothetical protein
MDSRELSEWIRGSLANGFEGAMRMESWESILQIEYLNLFVISPVS